MPKPRLSDVVQSEHEMAPTGIGVKQLVQRVYPARSSLRKGHLILSAQPPSGYPSTVNASSRNQPQSIRCLAASVMFRTCGKSRPIGGCSPRMDQRKRVIPLTSRGWCKMSRRVLAHTSTPPMRLPHRTSLRNPTVVVGVAAVSRIMTRRDQDGDKRNGDKVRDEAG